MEILGPSETIGGLIHDPVFSNTQEEMFMTQGTLMSQVEQLAADTNFESMETLSDYIRDNLSGQFSSWTRKELIQLVKQYSFYDETKDSEYKDTIKQLLAAERERVVLAATQEDIDPDSLELEHNTSIVSNEIDSSEKKKKKKKHKHKSHKDKSEASAIPDGGEADVETEPADAANEELEIARAIEQGPTEAELARKALIEESSDEEEKYLLRSRRQALRALRKETRPLMILRRDEARRSRAWLRSKLDDTKYRQILQDELLNKNVYVHVVQYINKGSDSEDSDNEMNDDALWETESSESDSGKANADADMIELSDDDDEESVSNENVKASLKMQEGSPQSIMLVPSPSKDVPVMKLKNIGATMHRVNIVQTNIGNRKLQLTQQLEQRKLASAAKFHAQQFGCSTAEQFHFVSEMHSHARNIKALLKGREEFQVALSKINLDKQLEQRALKYRSMADDDEGEYESENDEVENELMAAMTKGEINEDIARRIREENANWSEEENDNGDDEADDEPADMDVEEEVQALAQDEDQDDEDGLVNEDTAENPLVAPAVVSNVMDEESETVDAKAIPVVRTYGSAMRKSRKVSDDDEDSAEDPTQVVSSYAIQSTLEDDVGTDIPSNTFTTQTDDMSYIPVTQTDTQVVENHNATIDSTVEVMDPELKRKIEKVKQKMKNIQFRKMIEEEEKLSRKTKSSASAFFEDEADEEEEEGLQAGLMDYGFGNISNTLNEEQLALRIQRGELDHIVDDNADDLGDEDELERKRVEMQQRDDTEALRNIMNTVTHNKNRKGKARGRFGDDTVAVDEEEEAFIQGKQVNKNQKSGVHEGDDEVDDEELLQYNEIDELQDEFMQDIEKLKKERETEEKMRISDMSSSEDESDDDDEDGDDATKAELKERQRQEKRDEKLFSHKFSEIHKRNRYFRDQHIKKIHMLQMSQANTSDANSRISPSATTGLSLLPSLLGAQGAEDSSLAEVTAKAFGLLRRENSFQEAPVHEMSRGASGGFSGLSRADSVPLGDKGDSLDGRTLKKRSASLLPGNGLREPPQFKRTRTTSGDVIEKENSLNASSLSRAKSFRNPFNLLRSESMSGSKGARGDMYSAALDRTAIDSGYGLGMAVPPQMMRKRLQDLELSQPSLMTSTNSQIGRSSTRTPSDGIDQARIFSAIASQASRPVLVRQSSTGNIAGRSMETLHRTNSTTNLVRNSSFNSLNANANNSSLLRTVLKQGKT